MLGKLLSQPGALAEQDFSLAIDSALEKVSDMDGKDCVRVLRAIVQHGNRHGRLREEALRSLGSRLSDHLQDISANDMAELAESLADSSLPVVPVLARISVAFSSRASGAGPTQLTKMAVAFSTVRLADRRLFPRLAQSAVKQLHVFGTQDLPAFLSAFATVGICHEVLLTAAAKVLVARAPKLTALDLGMVAFGYAQFYLVFPAIVNMLNRRLPSCAHELPPLRLAELTVSCARLEVRPPGLVATISTAVQLQDLSTALLGEVVKSLSRLGLAHAPRVQEQLAAELPRRLHLASETQPVAWLLDLLESFGDASLAARSFRGGEMPSYVQEAMELSAGPLALLLRSATPQEVAVAYRSLRQLPPSLVEFSEGVPLWPLHSALAQRALALANASAFGFTELTSVLYSLLCLYRQLWWRAAGAQGEHLGPWLGEEHEDSLSEPSSPSWAMLRDSWRSLCRAWRQSFEAGAAAPGSSDRADSHQLEVLSSLLPPLQRLTGAQTRPQSHRPVAIQLAEDLQAIAPHISCRGAFFQGPVEVHAAAGRFAFCLLPDDAYFRQLKGTAFAEDSPSSSSVSPHGFELCLEKAVELQLLERFGWVPVPLASLTWRRLTDEGRRSFLASTLQ